ncbi:hydroxyacid dehydrogenase [Herbaspirillum sp. RV1423]|uniref:hydroxyacid dehydrogenase n=1 Tax=Herbaspirillum sp. RV1423 TaxID=1443993 RepID=UPI0004B20CB6|nr:hydroxyacid dehydrogenase [Herbaspirillum sp. RV1423]
MSQPIFRVGYIAPPMYPSFVETLQDVSGIELITLTLDDAPEKIDAALASCHGYYVRAARDELPLRWQLNADLLARMPLLLVAASYGAGYDPIDVPACTAAGVAVTNQAGGNAQAVAEHAIGMMMTLLKRIPEGHVAVTVGRIGRREDLMGRELAGKTVGIVGLGHVGARTAALLRVFGGKVLAYDPYLDEQACKQRGAEKVEMDELLHESDVITLHCPLSTDTRNLFDAEKFAAMRAGAIFINTARGSTYDEVALEQALQSGHLAGAGLDVWEQEPPSPEHPLLRHANVLASPHTAGVTHESRDRVARYAAQTFLETAAGKLPERLVNPVVQTRFEERRQLILKA